MSRHWRATCGLLLVYVIVGWVAALAHPSSSMPRGLTLAFTPLAIAAAAGVAILARSSRR